MPVEDEGKGWVCRKAFMLESDPTAGRESRRQDRRRQDQGGRTAEEEPRVAVQFREKLS